MFGWLLFFHIACVAFWLGAAATVFVLQRQARHTTESSVVHMTKNTMRSIVRGVVNPSALVVLATGIAMIVQMGLVGEAKPFWLSIMEHGGGLLVMISVLLTSWLLRNLTRSSEDATRQVYMARLSNSLAGVSVGVLAVILVVALRIT